MIDGPQNDSEKFERAVDEVIRRREVGSTVLIYCVSGTSRSPSVAAAAIPRLTELTLNEAFNWVLEHRPETDPHDALVRKAAEIVGSSPNNTIRIGALNNSVLVSSCPWDWDVRDYQRRS
jgi:dual specificity phosphatase 12